MTHLSTSRRNLSATSLSSVTMESVCALPNIPPNPFQWALRCNRYSRNAGRGFSSSSFTKTRNPPPSGIDLNGNQWPSGYVQVSTSPQGEAELIHINKSVNHLPCLWMWSMAASTSLTTSIVQANALYSVWKLAAFGSFSNCTAFAPPYKVTPAITTKKQILQWFCLRVHQTPDSRFQTRTNCS